MSPRSARSAAHLPRKNCARVGPVLPGSPDGSVDAVCNVDEGLVSENAPTWSMPYYHISLSQVQCSLVSCSYLPLRLSRPSPLQRNELLYGPSPGSPILTGSPRRANV